MIHKIYRTYIPAPRADMVVPRLDRLVAFTAAEQAASLNELFLPASIAKQKESEPA